MTVPGSDSSDREPGAIFKALGLQGDGTPKSPNSGTFELDADGDFNNKLLADFLGETANTIVSAPVTTTELSKEPIEDLPVSSKDATISDQPIAQDGGPKLEPRPEHKPLPRNAKRLWAR